MFGIRIHSVETRLGSRRNVFLAPDIPISYAS
jgi:hypothetical protein